MKQRLLGLVLAGAFAAPCYAHDGPPFPILVDHAFGNRTLSIWADPDVGVGTFYIYMPEERNASPGDPRFSIWVEPEDGRLPEVRHDSERADSSQPYQRVVYADFDKRGMWNLRITLEHDGQTEELRLPIDVTPPGAGKIDLLWFLSPFLLVGSLWAKVIFQRRAYAKSHS